jgi:hypothetical protein
VGLQPQLLDVRALDGLDPAFDAAMKQRAGATIVGVASLSQAHRGRIIDALASRRLPGIARERELVDAGGLMSRGIHDAGPASRFQRRWATNCTSWRTGAGSEASKRRN